MHLEEYLEEEGVYHKEFAKKLGLTPQTISNYINARRLPTLRIAALIEKETQGKVAFEDLLDWYNKKKAKNG